MKSFLLCLFLSLTSYSLLPGQSMEEPPSSSSIYFDLLFGGFPNFGNDGFNGHVTLGMGRQFSEPVGVGLGFVALGRSTVSTTEGMSGLGVQYRILRGNHHQYAKVEIGHLLGYNHTDDGPYDTRYERGFDPYFRIYLGHRAGPVTFGVVYTNASGIEQSLWEMDEQQQEFVDTGRRITEQIGLFQLYIGISLDGYR